MSLKKIIKRYDDGNIRSVYKEDENGLKQGIYDEYSEEGRLKIECFYKDDKKNRHFHEYDNEGRLKLMCSYKDGKKEVLCEHY